jgi:homopolymeric O-antigen transport system ATP-binding protein
MEPIIQVSNLSLSYILQHEKFDSLKENLIKGLRRRRREQLWAIRDLSFSLERGVSLGVIGRNGSGKSSLLKVLSQVLSPSEGEMVCRGQLSALLELGAGFHTDLTGYENLYLYGAILGISKADMQRRLARIAAFAELENFMDIPLKNYSTGMFMRLGFAAAIDVEPDVLLVDEILAVGDAAFQAKCFERIEQLKQEGVSIVFVSHDLGMVERFCEKTLWMEQGRMKDFGDSSDVIGAYIDQISPNLVAISSESTIEKVCLVAPEIANFTDPKSSGEVTIEKISLTYSRQHSTDALPTSEPFSLKCTYKKRKEAEHPVLRVTLQGENGRFCFDSSRGEYYVADISPNGAMELFLPGGSLPPDKYNVSVELASLQVDWPWCRLVDCMQLNLVGESVELEKSPESAGMFRISYDPFSISRCCRFHFLQAGLESDFATVDKGWHEVEYLGVGYRWSMQEAEWSIHNPDGRSRLLMTLSAHYLQPGGQPLVGQVWQGEKSIGKFVINDNQYHDVCLTLANRGETYAHLKMTLSDVYVPAKADGITDHRRLGVAVHKLRLV